MPASSSGTRGHQPIEYHDRQGHIWHAEEVAQLKVVSPSIDGPNLCLVIRFEREGEERFANWIGGVEWRWMQSLHRLFAEAEPGDTAEPGAKGHPAIAEQPNDAGVGPAPAETVALWVKLVASMGPDELDSFEERTFRQWEPASLGDLRAAARRRRRELGTE